MIKININPLSVNDCWKGRRFKTKLYKQYERALFFLLPKIELPEPPYEIKFCFGFSNPLCDWDNPVKPLQDILQKKYKFNDRFIKKASVTVEMVAEGKEFISFDIKNINGGV